MPGRLEGKVAVVSGAARGQGRSHAVRLASEGADVIVIDICADIATVPYPLATEADLAETVGQIQEKGRKAVSHVIDVRDRAALIAGVAAGVEELGGHLDVVVANAGVAPLGADVPVQAYFDGFGSNFIGAVNLIEASLPHLSDGASIIATGSTAALMKMGTSNPAFGAGGAAYTASKRAIGRLVQDLAAQLAGRRIRVNAIHPYNVNTAMLQNDAMYKSFRPDLESPTREDAELAFPHGSPMGLSYMEPSDVSDSVAFLASDESKYITGLQLKLDAGQMLAETDAGMPG